MDLISKINQNFHDSIHTKQMSVDMLADSISHAAQTITHALLSGGKVLACGNGVAAINAQHFCTCMLHNMEIQRPGLPALALNSDASTLTAITSNNNFSADQIYARQINALGQHNDILLAISLDGHDISISQAISAAQDRDIRVLALTGKSGGDIAGKLNPDDIEIRIPSDTNARISEAHQLVIHCICDLIDQQLLGSE